MDKNTKIVIFLVICVSAAVTPENVPTAVGLFTPVKVHRDIIEDGGENIGIFSPLRRIKELEPFFGQESKEREEEIFEYFTDLGKQVR